jgi:hypothetical protein
MMHDGASAFADRGTPGEIEEGAELYPGAVAELPLEYLVAHPEALAALYLEQLVPGTPVRVEHIADFVLRIPEPRDSVMARDYVVIYAALISALVFEIGAAADAIRMTEKAWERIGGLSVTDLADCRPALPWFWLAAGNAFAAAGRLREAQLTWRKIPDGEAGYPRFMSLSQTSLSQALDGDLRTASVTAALAQRLGTARGWYFGRQAIPAILAQAQVAACRLDTVALMIACAQLERETVGVPEWFVASEVFQALSLRLQGRAPEAMDRLQTIF